MNQANYYRISAVDISGNIGESSEFAEATILNIDPDLIPEVLRYTKLSKPLIQSPKFDMTYQRIQRCV